MAVGQEEIGGGSGDVRSGMRLWAWGLVNDRVRVYVRVHVCMHAGM